ncbi:MAG TPA: hypothetical protein VL527_04710 [Dongiaceae bacterium]|nr:hypothetical protein [Dongiaceae bacterium]
MKGTTEGPSLRLGLINLAVAATVILSGCSKPKAVLPPPPPGDSQFSKGQVWSIGHSPEDASNISATVYFVGSSTNYGHVIFVDVQDKKRFNKSHHHLMPFSEAALRQSTRELIEAKVDLPADEVKEFDNFYFWYRANLNSEQIEECYTKPVPDILQEENEQELQAQRKAEKENKPWPWWRFWE